MTPIPRAMMGEEGTGRRGPVGECTTWDRAPSAWAGATPGTPGATHDCALPPSGALTLSKPSLWQASCSPMGRPSHPGRAGGCTRMWHGGPLPLAGRGPPPTLRHCFLPHFSLVTCEAQPWGEMEGLPHSLRQAHRFKLRLPASGGFSGRPATGCCKWAPWHQVRRPLWGLHPRAFCFRVPNMVLPTEL